MGQTWRNSGQALQQPQLRRPVCEGAAQSLEVGMPGSYLGFGGGDLRAATGDSRRLLLALLRNFVERSPVSLEHSLLDGVFLIPPNDAIRVFRINLHQA